MQKGQLFSLDFIISMVAVTAAIALLIHSIEVNAYSQKEQQLHNELRQVTETAGNMLVSNPDIVCELTDDLRIQQIGFLKNCIPQINAGPLRISKEELGIPLGYECKIDKEGPKVQTDCSNGPLPDVENIYSSTREIVFYQGTGSPENKKKITKEQLEICMGNKAGDCDLQQDDITLWVWKE